MDFQLRPTDRDLGNGANQTSLVTSGGLGHFDPKLIFPELIFNGAIIHRNGSWWSATVNYLGSVMFRLFVPGTEQPRLERGRSSSGTDGLGWLTTGRTHF